MNPHFVACDPTSLDSTVTLMGEYYATDGLVFRPAAARQALAALVANPDWGRLWLIRSVPEQDLGDVVLTLGFSLEYLGQDGFIDELYLQPRARGRGLGRRAVEFVSVQARALGVRALHLEVLRSNPRARALYRRLRFIDQDRYLMTRRLD